MRKKLRIPTIRIKHDLMVWRCPKCGSRNLTWSMDTTKCRECGYVFKTKVEEKKEKKKRKK